MTLRVQPPSFLFVRSRGEQPSLLIAAKGFWFALACARPRTLREAFQPLAWSPQGVWWTIPCSPVAWRGLQVTVMSCQEARHFKRQVHGGWRSEAKGASNLFYDGGNSPGWPRMAGGASCERA